jgi:hypothetical protein
MKYLVAAMFLMMAFAAPALADRDLEAEKREAVQQEAAQKAAAARQAEAQKKKNAAMEKANAAMGKHLTDAQRKALGMPPAK